MKFETLISEFGVIPVFLGCFIEGETFAITGGVLVKHHILHLWPVLIAVAMGGFLSDMMYFLLARRHRGNPWVQKVLNRGAFGWISDNIGKHPGLIASVFRFVPGCRIIAPIFLAQSAIRTKNFAIRAGISAGIWAVLYVLAGHFLATLVQLILGKGHPLYKYVLIALVLAVLVMVMVVRRREKQRLARETSDL